MSRMIFINLPGGRSFEDPDGHHCEPMWMDPRAAEQGASAMEDA